LRLSPVRSEESVALDTERRGMPPYVRWDRFLERFDWRQGQHVTLVGTTGSGKTTLARQILPRREFVVVLATKAKDSSLYDPLLRQGYELVEKFDPNPREHPRVIFRPRLSAPTSEGRAEQKEAFRLALIDVFATGGWCVYADEVRYLTQYLGLQTEFETLWLQGRSLGVSLIVGTQRPVSIPLLAFDSADHLFLWRNTDRVNIQRMAEFAGASVEAARYTIPRLPRHEALYIATRTDEMVRTKVSK
jgi:hypothetical protein